MHPSAVLIDPIVSEAGRTILGVPVPDLPGTPGVPGALPVSPPVAVPTVGPGVVVPLPSHGHIAGTTHGAQVWWQMTVVLIRDPSIWPDREGDRAAGRNQCLTSIDVLRTAQGRGDAVAGHDISTNPWLFFANQPQQGPVGENAPAPGSGAHHG
ncbi:hypothetical protein [Pseudonocardia sp. HH130629-09]|uniref:hypothetical protein n=1 Tax=Pseudonocardia sp. HH130629-09 TaxID=1641402 RepID=UPI0006CB3BFC|nr:hypothetical protein [Pseudonocardia sp. HH130629-09]ALE84495.1 hypothetical protein XF36_16250 [Pseudonocardia sp. HH130629-09]